MVPRAHAQEILAASTLAKLLEAARLLQQRSNEAQMLVYLARSDQRDRCQAALRHLQWISCTVARCATVAQGIYENPAPNQTVGDLRGNLDVIIMLTTAYVEMLDLLSEVADPLPEHLGELASLQAYAAGLKAAMPSQYDNLDFDIFVLLRGAA